MPSNNKIIIASAGAGKTTRIVRSLGKHQVKRSLVVTYTLNNEAEIRRKLFAEYGCTPKHVFVKTWFRFLLEDFVRPYQSILYEKQRIDGLAFVNGISVMFAPEHDIRRHYLHSGKNIYSDKIAKFGYKANEQTRGRAINRLQQLYDTIYVDEVQDLAAWDLDILELLLKSKIDIVLVGDPRQATYKTNNAAKYAKYSKSKILLKFNEWQQSGLVNIELMNHSHRCNQAICDFADRFFPTMGNSVSYNTASTGHDGVFIVRSRDVQRYVQEYSPKVLRYNKREKCAGLPASNFKESKGLTFPRVLIFPHNPIRKLLSDSDFLALAEPSAMYVAVTRAQQSVAIVYDGECSIDGVELYQIN